MITGKCTIGIDYGTLSARAVIVDVLSGKELATAVFEYCDGVIDERLPGTNIFLEPDWALQNPNDYIEALKHTIPAILKDSCIDPDDVIGVGIDFTACTLLPTKADGTPLCMLPEWRENPHAWVKLWKHHAAQPEANKINEIALERGYDGLLARYGGKTNSEWFFPKVWQILDESPEVYAAADRILEAGDWIVWQLTGVETRNACAAGYKAMWSKHDGFPPTDFFKALDPQLEYIVDEKMMTNISPLGTKAGEITAQVSKWTGLKAGTAVAVANVDAHVSVPAATVTDAGRMVMIMGTSICHMVLGESEEMIPGICGVVQDGIIPNLPGYEAGQTCVGDHFQWFIDSCLPAHYRKEARTKGISLFQLLEEKAAILRPGASGLLALDWWNGNRSVLVDADLSGMILGLTLLTKPEEIYRALIEATAFGTRLIIETFQHHNVPVEELIASGGLPDRNKLLMQIYSDVTGLNIFTSGTTQIGAVGSAMHGAVAAGSRKGGYDTILDASKKMARLSEVSYKPIPEYKKIYDELFAEYVSLHDYFGRSGNDVMKQLKLLKKNLLSQS